VIRSQKFKQEAINAACAEEYVKGPTPRVNNNDRNNMIKAKTQKIRV